MEKTEQIQDRLLQNHVGYLFLYIKLMIDSEEKNNWSYTLIFDGWNKKVCKMSKSYVLQVQLI